MNAKSLFQRAAHMLPVGLLSAAILCIVLVLTLMPSSGVPSVNIPHIDKVAHFLMFGAMAVVFLFDASRYRGSISWSMLAVCAVAASALGGLIELIQGAMSNGRGCELADFVADAAGAFILPALSMPLLRRLCENPPLSLQCAQKASQIPQSVRELYHSAFPSDERRPWTVLVGLMKEEPDFHVSLIKRGRKTVGFLNWWSLDGVVYIEHFAIDPSLRSNGLGARSLELFFKEHNGVTVILEAEPDGSNDMAARRLRFYGRCGFDAHTDFHYVQPPYTAESSPVELVLMTRGSVTDLSAVADLIKKRVYGA